MSQDLAFRLPRPVAHHLNAVRDLLRHLDVDDLQPAIILGQLKETRSSQPHLFTTLRALNQLIE